MDDPSPLIPAAPRSDRGSERAATPPPAQDPRFEDQANYPSDTRDLDAPTGFVPPRTPTEQGLAGIWCELLQREHVGIHDNFFHLGGNSLLATRVLSRIHRKFNRRLPFSQFFNSPTLADLAGVIDAAAAAPRNPNRPVNSEATSAPLAGKNGNGTATAAKSEPSGADLRERDSLSQRGGSAFNPQGVLVGRTDERQLSFAQERLWFLEQLEPGVAFNNVPVALKTLGALDVGALGLALSELIRRHETLRCEFHEKSGRPVALSQEAAPFTIPVDDLSDLPTNERHPEARRLIDAEARRPVDLTRGPLLRARLVRLARDEFWLVLVTHHIACDGWSLEIFYRELSAIYDAIVLGRPSLLPELPMEYGDFAAWQRGWAQGHLLDEQLAYWKEQLADAPTILALPTDRPRPAVQSYRGDVRCFHLPATLHARLTALSQRENVTIFMLLLAAWQTLLHRYSSQEDILVGTPIAVRPHFETEGLIGLFLNMLVLRGNLSGDPSFSKLLQRVRTMALAAYEHQDLPFEKLVDAMQPERDLSRSPLFQVMFVWHNQPAAPLRLSAISLEPLEIHSGTAKFDLTLSLEPAGDGLNGFIEFNTDLFDAATIARMIGHFQALLEAILANPEERLSRLPLLTETERRLLLTDWNNNRLSFPERCVHECFEEQVERTPDAVAIVFGEEQLTYHELDQHANALAHKLHELGVGPDSRVGLCMERSMEMMVGLLGILKAGGAYLPLDPTYPKERLVFMVQDAEVQVLLTQEKFRLPAGIAAGSLGAAPPSILELACTQDATGSSPLKLISLPGLSGGSRNVPQRSAPHSAVTPDHLAYMIYTSGSTGKPKGVMVTHRNVRNFFAGMDRLFGTEPGVWLAVTSISFDISVLELFWTLARGYKVILHHDSGAERGLPNSSQQSLLPPASRAAPNDRLVYVRGGTASEGKPGQDSRRFPAKSAVVSPPLLEASPGGKAERRGMDFSLFYFASDASEDGENKYRLLVEGAKIADRNGFTAVWTPERHFHAFGGLYPNPALTGAALAMVTERIRIRAGSVVLPLHDVIRVAEEWALVDNLSRGRVDISFASGWHANDFVLRPENYSDRHAGLFRDIDVVRRLWRGESIQRRNGAGQEVTVRVLPRPMQPELPFWVTAAGSPETFRKAGELGANLLTHLLGQSIEELAAKIAVYRAAWIEAGHSPEGGKVSLMLHTFVGEDANEVRETVRQPFSEYLKTSLDLIARNASLGFDPKKLTPDDVDTLIARVFDRYFDTSGLFGTPDNCLQRVEQLKAIGVDEIACLIDFGVETDTVLAGLAHLNEVRERSNDTGEVLGVGRPAGEESSVASASSDSDLDLSPLREPLSIPEQIARHEVTHMQCTPSLAAMLLQDPSAPQALGLLRKLMLGGEALPPKLAGQIQKVLRGQLFNLYGPTETTIWSTAHFVENASDASSIGKPLANTEIYIVDRHDQLVPVGIPGEVLIGGKGVARGYHRQPELTRQKFIRHPFSADPNARLYRTGDLARFTSTGQIEFLGRIDQQVKLRGHRIELGEIETVLAQYPDVREVVVTTWGDSAVEKRLVAYVVPKPKEPLPGASLGSNGNGFDAVALREFLKQRLPEYMVPSVVTLLDALPLTANGKVDRRALPAPDEAGATAPKIFVAPGSPTEKALARIWGDVLERKQIGVHDNFFELGGHSLLIMHVLARVREAFHVDLRMRCLFDSPTIAGLALSIEQTLLKEIDEMPEKEANRLLAKQTAGL